MVKTIVDYITFLFNDHTFLVMLAVELIGSLVPRSTCFSVTQQGLVGIYITCAGQSIGDTVITVIEK